MLTSSLTGVLCGVGTFPYSREVFDRLIPQGLVLSVVRDPVYQFLSSWKVMQYSAILSGIVKRDVSLLDYLNNRTAYISKMNEAQKYHITDVIATDFGLKPDATEEVCKLSLLSFRSCGYAHHRLDKTLLGLSDIYPYSCELLRM